MFEKFIVHNFKEFNNKKVVFCTADFGSNKIHLQDKLSEEKLLEHMSWLKHGAWDYFIIKNGKARMVRSIDLYYLFSEGYHLLNLTTDEDGYYCVVNDDIEKSMKKIVFNKTILWSELSLQAKLLYIKLKGIKVYLYYCDWYSESGELVAVNIKPYKNYGGQEYDYFFSTKDLGITEDTGEKHFTDKFLHDIEYYPMVELSHDDEVLIEVVEKLGKDAGEDRFLVDFEVIEVEG